MSQQIYKHVLEPTHNKCLFLYLHIAFLLISYYISLSNYIFCNIKKIIYSLTKLLLYLISQMARTDNKTFEIATSCYCSAGLFYFSPLVEKCLFNISNLCSFV